MSIFIKAATINNKIILDELYNNIPEPNYREPQQLRDGQTEWKIRVFEYNGKKYIEISRKSYDGVVKYINKSGALVDYNIDMAFDDYVVDVIYFYSTV